MKNLFLIYWVFYRMVPLHVSVCQLILNVYLIGQLFYFFCEANNQCSATQDCAELQGGRPPPPHSPMVPCYTLDLEFLVCSEPLDLKGNETAREELGYGCTKDFPLTNATFYFIYTPAVVINVVVLTFFQYGGQKYEDVQFTSVNCTVLLGIECYGPRTFHRSGFPCIKYSGHYFLTTLLYSVLLGFLGMDRFCLGHTGTAVGKLLTLGGMGIWWIVDIVLLVTGNLTPDDGSNWVPYA
ncbi:unnamed protein product [Larinioides sclopetarius]|uniref:TM2 domain-containing protein n=1 Tax=Larinioides sclopetarius TaxID=280406 RepID=A0AAV1YTF1_9ARAC